jgi:adenosylmethionine-8-amino-7-oxononanoate aminotransferase
MKGATKLACQVSNHSFEASMVALCDGFLCSPGMSTMSNQPQRKNLISRDLSYQGNTVAALSLSGHPSRCAPFDEILQHESYHKVSPAYAKRFQKADESEGQYVERLRQELEDKILELGPETVISCTRSPHLLAVSKRADHSQTLPKLWSGRRRALFLLRRATSEP